MFPTACGTHRREARDCSKDRSAAWHAPASLWEEGDVLHLELDLPGVTLEQIELTVEKGTLKISAERKAPEGERTEWHNERGFGRVTRTLTLPEGADPNTIEASLNHGVLHVTVARLPEAQAKKIDIRTG